VEFTQWPKSRFGSNIPHYIHIPLVEETIVWQSNLNLMLFHSIDHFQWSYFVLYKLTQSRLSTLENNRLKSTYRAQIQYTTDTYEGNNKFKNYRTLCSYNKTHKISINLLYNINLKSKERIDILKINMSHFWHNKMILYHLSNYCSILICIGTEVQKKYKISCKIQLEIPQKSKSIQHIYNYHFKMSVPSW
jgi:hypothetical protein